MRTLTLNETPGTKLSFTKCRFHTNSAVFFILLNGTNEFLREKKYLYKTRTAQYAVISSGE